MSLSAPGPCDRKWPAVSPGLARTITEGMIEVLTSLSIVQ